MHTPSPPYHPKKNGQVERFVQSFKQTVRKGMTHHKANLDEAVADFLTVYRNIPHTRLQESSCKIVIE